VDGVDGDHANLPQTRIGADYYFSAGLECDCAVERRRHVRKTAADVRKNLWDPVRFVADGQNCPFQSVHLLLAHEVCLDQSVDLCSYCAYLLISRLTRSDKQRR